MSWRNAWIKWLSAGGLGAFLTSCRAFSQYIHSYSIAPVLPFVQRAFCQHINVPAPHTPSCFGQSLSLNPPLGHCTELEGGAHTCILKGILSTYSQLSQYFKEQKDGIWFMRFPLALPRSLNLLHVICEGSDPQDQMDVAFPLFSFKVKLWKTVRQYRINSKAVPLEAFIFKKHCCQLVPKMSKEEWRGKIQQHCWKDTFSCS